MCTQGITALMYATMAGHMKVIKELLLAKADPTLRSRVSSMFTVYLASIPLIVRSPCNLIYDYNKYDISWLA